MTQKGFDFWYKRTREFYDDVKDSDPDRLDDALSFLLKSGKTIVTTLGAFFDITDFGEGVVMVYPDTTNGKDNTIYVIDIESIEAIGW